MKLLVRVTGAAISILLVSIIGANAKPAIEENLASSGAWTFQAAGSTAAPQPLAVPAGGWRLNGFPTAVAGTYERRLKIPKLATGGPQATFVEFEAVNWEAKVFAGPDAQHLRPVGTHLSAWTPFRVDISKAVTPGNAALLRVEVRDRSFFKDDKGHFTVPAATEWNDRQGRGILRGVALRVYPSVFVSDVVISPSTSAQELTCRVAITNTEAKLRQITLSSMLSSATAGAKWTYPAVPPRTIALAPGETKNIVVGPLPWTPGRASWWWPNVPFEPDYHAQLHKLSLTLRSPGSANTAPLQTEEVRFGFCTPGQTGTFYTLNGVRINLRGDSLPEGTIGTDAFARLPGFLPPTKSAAGWPGAVRNYQRLNFNVIRMHQVPATRYMMDVCDELGMLVIPETAIRGGGVSKENIEQNPEAFATHLRELIVRDRNHPSVFKWSLENELFGAPEPFIHHLYDVCREADGVRPCSIDDGVPGREVDYPSYPGFAVIEHYSQPAGTPDAAGRGRNDRPFGQGEFVWPAGNSQRGPVLFSLMTRALRAHDNSDIRPYTLIDMWPGVIPGLKPGSFPDPHLPPDSLEQGGVSLLNPPDPWRDARIQLVQRSFAPVAVYDTGFDALNTPSNGIGEWPTLSARVTAGQLSNRHLVVFNDTFKPAVVDVQIEPVLYLDGDKKQPLIAVSRTVKLGPGEHGFLDVPVFIPAVTENRPLLIAMSASSAGQSPYHESVLCAVVPQSGGTTVEYLGRDDRTQGAWPAKYGKEAFIVPAFNGVVNGQIAGFNVNRGVGLLPDPKAVNNTLNQYLPVQSAEIQWLKQDTTDDVRVPVHGPGLTERTPVAFKAEGGVLLMRADIQGSAQVLFRHKLTLYFVDFFRKHLTADIGIFDLRGNRLATHHVEDFGSGVYEQFLIRGSVVVRITSGDSEPPQLSGMFVDGLDIHPN